MTCLRTVLRALVVVTVLAVPVPALAQEGAVPAAVTLDKGWDFKGPGAADFHPVAIPHVFDPRPEKREFGGTVGWYRLRFTAPDAAPGFSWALHFDQVRRQAKVFLNGALVGVHTDPYVPFELPVAALREGRQNELLVRVDNRKGKEPREGWWNWGGITRSVRLVPQGRVVLQDAAVLPRVSCPPGGDGCRASAEFDGVLVNRGETTVEVPKVTVRLSPPGGGPPVEGSSEGRALAPGEQTRLRFAFSVPDAKLWSPGEPQRYASETVVSADGAVTAVDHQAVGLREVAVRDGVLTVNGRQVDLRGAAVQEDLRGHGPALTAADDAEIVRQLQELGANVTRAHYLLNDDLLSRLDAAGIMVWSQAPIYHRDKRLRTTVERQRALETVRDTVLAARRHPAVITHSVANELSAEPDRTPGTRAFLDAAYGVVKDLDPTVPVSVDLLSYPGYGRQTAYARYDLLGINSYFGWYPGKADHSTARLGDLAPFLDRMRRMYPRQGIVLTEFGAESTFNGPADRKETYAFQSRYVRDVLDIVDDRPFVSGAIYWTLREFAVKPDWDGGAKRAVARDGIHNKGLISYGGRVKPAWHVARAAFEHTPLYRSVTPAEAAGMPEGRGGNGGSAILVLAMCGVLGLLALDGWALAGILRARRAPQSARRPAPSGQLSPGLAQD